jgi:hypothetical protein
MCLRSHMHTYVTIRGTSAAMASSILAAATGGLLYGQILRFVVLMHVLCCAYGTKMAVADAWVSLTASATLLKTGRPRCSVPAFLGFVPPTTFVPASCQHSPPWYIKTAVSAGRIPYSIACVAWKLSHISFLNRLQTMTISLTFLAFQ